MNFPDFWKNTDIFNEINSKNYYNIAAHIKCSMLIYYYWKLLN